MIYSVHNPVTGAFDYFEGGPATPINDDLPTPILAGGSKIGVAALSAGRPLPPGSRRVGQGPLPVGSVCSGEPGLWKSTKKGAALPSGLSGVFTDAPRVKGGLVVGAIAAVAVGMYLLLAGDD